MTQSKYKSRTFWLAVLWSIFVPLGLIVAPMMARYGVETSWLCSLVTSSGIIVGAFVGGEKLRKGMRERGGRENAQ